MNEQRITDVDILEYKEYVKETRMSAAERLAADVEKALADYLGVDAFTGTEFPELAQSFAGAVAASEVTQGNVTRMEVAANAKEYGMALARLIKAISNLTE